MKDCRRLFSVSSGALWRSRVIRIATALCVLSLPAAAEPPPRADRVVVIKSKRLMTLYEGNRVLRAYPIAIGMNPLGHKQRRGDQRTPEGTYTLDYRLDNSRYHKAFHISYPNDRDRAAAAERGDPPGGGIVLHGIPPEAETEPWLYDGGEWTDGCIAVANAAMDEIWDLVPEGTPIEIRP